MTRARRWARGFLAGGLAVVAAATLVPNPSGAEAVAGSAGTDTTLALTESAVTVRGRGSFESLEISVNQTENLGNQAISVAWSGGAPTVRAGGADFAENFLQIMQCWGDDDGTDPQNPGPPPEQCVFGATDGVFGGRNGTLIAAGGFADDRIVARGDFETFDPDDGFYDVANDWLWKPFRSVTGEEIGIHVDTSFSPAVESGDYWLNPLFNVITTNEVVAGRTRPDGTGEELFEVTTGAESSGLGCGQAVLARDGGEREIPRCWLVIVPRGSALEENAGTIAGSNWAENSGIMTSPLWPAAWTNRIAIPLEFNPVDSPCDLGDDQRRIVGSELLVRAVTSWQPALCATPGLPPYGYASVGDASARLQLTSGAAGAPGMAVSSRPLPPNAVTDANPVTYAPLSLSGIVIGFNIERVPDVEVVNPDIEQLRGIRVAELNLTPRLVAKLLTQSYSNQTSIGGQLPEDYEWAQDNPRHLDEDPDFVRFNPEFELLRPLATKNLGGLVLAAGTSDAAGQAWEWILADPEAKAWLEGAPDEFGMVVNPVYAATATANSAGIAFGDPLPESFPKSDPYCYQAPSQGPGGAVVPPVLCGTDWLPYAPSWREAAQRTRAANDGARTTLDPAAGSPERVWLADGPQRLGARSILSLVDSPTAIQYGLQTARLSRAGDNGDDRAFIAAGTASLTAGVESMVPSDAPDVLVPDPRAQPADAYPLTALTYAAVTPLSLDDQARQEYAAFVEYAVGAGQVAGPEVGQLPPGYAELPAELKDQAAEAAVAIREAMAPSPPDATPPPTPAPAASGPAAPPPQAQGAPAEVPSSSPSESSGSPARRTPAPSGTDQTPTGEPKQRDDRPADNPLVDALRERGVTPISSAGGARFVVPVLGALVLLSMLGALEVTKRPRRATAARRAGQALAPRRAARRRAAPRSMARRRQRAPPRVRSAPRWCSSWWHRSAPWGS